MSTTDDTRTLRQVSHAGYSGDGVKLAFGLRWDGVIIHISEAKRGGACGCQCPAQNCRRKLIAHKPESDIRPHFAHAPLTAAERKAGIAPNCQSGQMTALHAYAERLLNETKRLVLAPLTASAGARRQTIRSAKEFSFDAAKLETMDGETVPDVILIKGEHRMHVEIYVTHRCGPEKRAKITAAKISAMEIDLSGLPADAPPERYRTEILKTAPREWIYNKKLEELREALEAQTKAAAERAETHRREKILELKAAYDAAHKRALASNWREADDVQKIVEAGDADLLEGGSSGAGFFAIHPKVWKATILNRLYDHFGVSSTRPIIKRSWLADFLGSLQRDDDSLFAEAGLPAGGPEEAVMIFLRCLAKQGVAEDHGWKWSYTQRHLDELGRRKRERQRIAYELAERASRHRRLADLVNEIISLAGIDEGASFGFEIWVGKRTEGLEQTPKTIADEGDAGWRRLIKDLSVTRAVLKDESAEPTGHCGLPIKQALVHAARRQVARAEQKRLEAAEAAEQERQARITEIERAYWVAIGDFDSGWLDDPTAELGGLSPRAAAAHSFDLLARSKRLLEVHIASLRLKAQALAYLRERLVTIFKRDEERIDLFLRGSNPGLRGRISPREYVRDQATADDCLDLLKRPGSRQRRS